VLEVEVELEPTGTEEELGSLARSLEEEWHLSPVSLSKFERALHHFDGPPGKARLLSPSERQTLMTVSQRTDRHARRAAALLALDNSDTQEEAAKLAGVTDRSVRYWLSRFRDTRLSLFPESVLTAATREQPDGRQEPASTCPTDRPQAEDGGEQALKAEAAAGLPVQPPSKPGLCADDSMAEAARKTFRFHLQRMEFHEPGAREGKVIEELHDMRVATRRMRAAMTVFGDYLDSRKMKPYLKGLRRTGRALGPVRDLDVFREKMQGYLDPLAPAQKHDLDPLLAAWELEHRSARRAMLVHLGSERYLRFKTGFGTFLQTPGAGALPVFSPTDEPLPHRLCHVVPLVIHQRAADIRAYEQWVTEPEVPLERLHQLRIACKALRYALEFFREILGAEAKSLIDTMKEVQDHLGDLQDAVVASNLLGAFLTWGTWGQRRSNAADVPGKPIVAPGVATYLAARQREIQQLARDFPQVWLKIQSIKFHEQLVSATAVLW
jgi:CHAD domain-containing protein/transposase-like protein